MTSFTYDQCDRIKRKIGTFDRLIDRIYQQKYSTHSNSQSSYQKFDKSIFIQPTIKKKSVNHSISRNKSFINQQNHKDENFYDLSDSKNDSNDYDSYYKDEILQQKKGYAAHLGRNKKSQRAENFYRSEVERRPLQEKPIQSNVDQDTTIDYQSRVQQRQRRSFKYGFTRPNKENHEKEVPDQYHRLHNQYKTFKEEALQDSNLIERLNIRDYGQNQLKYCSIASNHSRIQHLNYSSIIAESTESHLQSHFFQQTQVIESNKLDHKNPNTPHDNTWILQKGYLSNHISKGSHRLNYLKEQNISELDSQIDRIMSKYGYSSTGNEEEEKRRLEGEEGLVGRDRGVFQSSGGCEVGGQRENGRKVGLLLGVKGVKVIEEGGQDQRSSGFIRIQQQEQLHNQLKDHNSSNHHAHINSPQYPSLQPIPSPKTMTRSLLLDRSIEQLNSRILQIQERKKRLNIPSGHFDLQRFRRKLGRNEGMESEVVVGRRVFGWGEVGRGGVNEGRQQWSQQQSQVDEQQQVEGQELEQQVEERQRGRQQCQQQLQLQTEIVVIPQLSKHEPQLSNNHHDYNHHSSLSDTNQLQPPQQPPPLLSIHPLTLTPTPDQIFASVHILDKNSSLAISQKPINDCSRANQKEESRGGVLRNESDGSRRLRGIGIRRQVVVGERGDRSRGDRSRGKDNGSNGSSSRENNNASIRIDNNNGSYHPHNDNNAPLTKQSITQIPPIPPTTLPLSTSPISPTPLPPLTHPAQNRLNKSSLLIKKPHNLKNPFQLLLLNLTHQIQLDRQFRNMKIWLHFYYQQKDGGSEEEKWNELREMFWREMEKKRVKLDTKKELIRSLKEENKESKDNKKNKDKDIGGDDVIRSQYEKDVLQEQILLQTMQSDYTHLKQLFTLNIHQHDPFFTLSSLSSLSPPPSSSQQSSTSSSSPPIPTPTPSYSLSTLYQKYESSLTHWLTSLYHQFSSKPLISSGFSNNNLDLQRKGHVVLEDLVRLVNINVGRDYRNRDLVMVWGRVVRDKQRETKKREEQREQRRKEKGKTQRMQRERHQQLVSENVILFRDLLNTFSQKQVIN